MVAFAITIGIGMPIAPSLIILSTFYCMFTGMSLAMMSINMFSGMTSFVLIAIPLFILTAEIMDRTQVTDKLFGFCKDLVGYIPGGLGHVNCVTSVIFAGMSGAAVADVGGIGHLCYSEMVRAGYDKNFSGSVTMASSLIGPIIPPSIPIIIYAMCTNTSAGRLLIGGLLPGFIMGAALMIWVYIVSKKRNFPYMKMPSWRVYLKSLGRSFLRAIPALMTAVILLAAIYTGIVTSTEAAALAALYALILGVFLYRTLSLKGFVDALVSVFKKCGTTLLLIAAGKAFGFVLTNEGIQMKLTKLFYQISGGNKWGILVLCLLLFLILGCVSDSTVNIMLFSSMVASIMTGVGFDPIHVGILIVLCAMLGNITPPVGAVLMGVCSMEKLKVHEVTKELVPPILILIAVMAFIAVVPGTATFLPSLIME